MTKKMIWGLVTLIFLIVTATVWVVLHNRVEMKQLEREAAKIVKTEVLPKQHRAKINTPPVTIAAPSVEEHPVEPHVHDDNTVHTPQTITSKPFANFNPPDDPVEAAWKQLEYIKNNIWEWGGIPSPRALELMEEMPDPLTALETVGGCGEDIIELLDELASLQDPRTAEFLVSYECDSGIRGKPPKDALVAMGPAALPALIARLDDKNGENHLYPIPQLLVRIIKEHREEIGGIVNHIILPKLESIASSESTAGDFSYINLSCHLFRKFSCWRGF